VLNAAGSVHPSFVARCELNSPISAFSSGFSASFFLRQMSRMIRRTGIVRPDRLDSPVCCVSAARHWPLTFFYVVCHSQVAKYTWFPPDHRIDTTISEASEKACVEPKSSVIEQMVLELAKFFDS